MIRTSVTLGSGLLWAATPVKVAEHVAADSMPTVYLKKPSELPLYAPLHETDPRNQNKKAHQCHEKRNAVEQNLDEGFRAVRTETNKVLDVIAANKDSVNDSYEKVVAETRFIHEYLNREENRIPRAGAVILGGMSGIIMGIRGGIFRKAFYGLIGTGIMGSICYPKETEEIAQAALGEAKKGVTVAVNFAYGVKPGDEAPPINFPVVPTSLAELESSIGSALKAAKNLVFPGGK